MRRAPFALLVFLVTSIFAKSTAPEVTFVSLYDPKQIIGLVYANLPLAGNERLPLMERTDIFRVRGIIDDARMRWIDLRDATLEYVSSGKA